MSFGDDARFYPIAVLHLWRWQRRAAGRSAGSVPSAASAQSGHISHNLVPAEIQAP